MIRVLIADDQALVRGGFRAILSSEPDVTVVGEAADGRTAVELAGRLRPDVILMDIRMPGVDGLEATRQILSAGVRSQILVLTTFDDDEYLYAALRAGAGGFLLKTVAPDQLAHSVRVVARGDALLDPLLTQRLLDDFISRPPPGGRAPALAQLTDRELEVLTLIGRGLSNGEIARRLFITEATAKTHVSNILAKANVRDRVAAVVLAYETGLVRAGS